MNKSLSVDSILCGGIFLGSSILVHRIFPDAVTTALWIGIGGAALSVLLGVLGLLGYAVRRPAILAMTLLVILLFLQTVASWLAAKAGVTGAKSGAMIFTFLSAFASVHLVNLIQNRNAFFNDEPQHRDRNKHGE
jgi:hypothetical protein